MILGITVERARIPVPRLTTVSLTVDFLSAARSGDWLEGRATVLRLGRSLAFATAVLQAGPALVARASGVFRVLEEERRA